MVSMLLLDKQVTWHTARREAVVWCGRWLGMSLKLSQFAMLSTRTKEGPPGFELLGLLPGIPRCL